MHNSSQNITATIFHRFFFVVLLLLFGACVYVCALYFYFHFFFQVPLLFIKGLYVGGYDDIIRMFRSGLLRAILRKQNLLNECRCADDCIPPDQKDVPVTTL
jgi:hypothetical protein